MRPETSQGAPLAVGRRTRSASLVRLELAQLAGQRVRSAQRAQRLAADVAERWAGVRRRVPGGHDK